MISKLFEALYLKVFVNIVTNGSKSIVYIEMCNKKDVISSAEESFTSVPEHNKMLEFIESYTKESPFHYVSYLDHSPLQGAISTSSDKSKHFDLSLSKYVNYNKDWLYYTSKSDLNLLKKRYADIGVDYIFSPFVLLAEFFKDKLASKMTMFVLVEESYVTLSIFDENKLLFAEHIEIEHTKNTDKEDEDKTQDIDDFEIDEMSIDLEDVDVVEDIDEMLDELDDLSDIEDLDSMDDIEEFSEEEEAAYTPLEANADPSIPVKINDDYKIFSIIQNSMDSFYKDAHAHSNFIETVYIADGVGDLHDLKQSLEEEMFLSVYVRRIDVCVEICELAKMENP